MPLSVWKGFYEISFKRVLLWALGDCMTLVDSGYATKRPLHDCMIISGVLVTQPNGFCMTFVGGLAMQPQRALHDCMTMSGVLVMQPKGRCMTA
eukprot:1243350-Amphidinium_carterae.1